MRSIQTKAISCCSDRPSPTSGWTSKPTSHGSRKATHRPRSASTWNRQTTTTGSSPTPTSQAIWRTIAGNSNAGWTTSARYANTCNAATRNCRCWNADPHTRRIPASHQKNGGTHDRQKETRQTLQGHVAVHRSLRESKGEPMPRNKHGKPASPQASKTGTYRNSGKAGSVTTCSRHCAG